LFKPVQAQPNIAWTLMFAAWLTAAHSKSTQGISVATLGMAGLVSPW
jgi:hypothetical protein